MASVSKPSRILVVEDERIVARDLERVLARLGYEVVGLAHSGQQAVHRATELRPDLVLMDICLEGDDDGITAAATIQERLHIPIVYATALADKDTLQRAKLTAPDGYVVKPLHERELEIAIELALSRHQDRTQDRVRAFVLSTRAVVGAGVRVALETSAKITVEGAASSLSEALPFVKRVRPDVVFLDQTLTELRNTDWIGKLIVASPGTKVIVIALDADDASEAAARMKGAAIVVRDTSETALIGAAHSALSDLEESADHGIEALSDREQEVLFLLAKGHSYKEIGKRLRIGVRSVATYRERLTDKLGIRDRAGLIRIANALAMSSKH